MRYAVVDIETRIDKALLKQVFYPLESLDEEAAYERFLDSAGDDFLPVSLHVPISIAVGNVGEDHVLQSVESLALEDYSEEGLIRSYWERAERFDGCIVTFNGRRFDVPVLELQALRHAVALPGHFGPEGTRARYSERHLDLHDFLTNFGAARVRGGLDLLLKLIGLPGKSAIDGADVQALYELGRLDEIHRYCRSDVIQTFFLFLRTELMRGRISRDRYRFAFEASAHFLEQLPNSHERRVLLS